MKKILLLDCHGTLTLPLSGSRFPQNDRDLKIILGADCGVRKAAKAGYTCIGIANEGAVEAGHKTLANAIAQKYYTLELFPELVAIYLCPDFAGNECWQVTRNRESAIPIHQQGGEAWIGQFRKPAPGMIRAALWQYNVDVERDRLWLIGDDTGKYHPDSGAAEKVGIPFLHADLWHEYFTSEVSTIENFSPQQREFLQECSSSKT